MNVPDVASAKHRRKIFAVELRIAPGFGYGAHVRDLLHFMSCEQVEELLDRASGVADCENRGTHYFTVQNSVTLTAELGPVWDRHPTSRTSCRSMRSSRVWAHSVRLSYSHLYSIIVWRSFLKQCDHSSGS
jgi:hypothetical protein